MVDNKKPFSFRERWVQSRVKHVLNKVSNLPKKMVIKKEIRTAFLEIIFYGLFWGAFINYSLFGLFGVPFKLETFTSYGLFFYLIKSQLIPIWRNIWFKFDNIGEPYR